MIYNRFIWSYNSCSVSLPSILTETVPATAPSTPITATHLAFPESIIWNWQAVSGAAGYKWSYINDFSSAEDMGESTSKTESSLNCNVEYSRFAWAYNGCGYSTPVTMVQSTTTCFTCGSSFLVNHVAGNVAPVTKTVTYGTVTNIPGETTKCWITSNLGSDHQATAVDDNTEASAGWYWQFNHMQGFKHDGATRTPNTVWITAINDDSDWAASNDPCPLELGSTWRIPTLTEWTNVKTSGSWANWNGPWNSALKIHAAGYLYNEDGSLYLRGSYGFYWSSTQGYSLNGWYLYLESTGCDIFDGDKALGFSVRCLSN
jgi:hypothetical protein